MLKVDYKGRNKQRRHVYEVSHEGSHGTVEATVQVQGDSESDLFHALLYRAQGELEHKLLECGHWQTETVKQSMELVELRTKLEKVETVNKLMAPLVRMFMAGIESGEFR